MAYRDMNVTLPNLNVFLYKLQINCITFGCWWLVGLLYFTLLSLIPVLHRLKMLLFELKRALHYSVDSQLIF